MAAGLEEAIADQADQLSIEIIGQVNVPDDKVVATRAVKVVGCRPPGYNFPTEKVVGQTKVVADLVRNLRRGDLCLALISGGGSALLELPKIPLEDLVSLSKSLSDVGADIESLNTVRRCLSQVKAGGLARMKPTGLGIEMASLIISDVVGDNLAMISSGPTVIDSAETYGDEAAQRKAALEILHRRLEVKQIPESVTKLLSSPVESTTEVNGGSVENILIGSNRIAVQAATDAARSAGYEVATVDDDLNPYAEVSQLGRAYAQSIARYAESEKPWALITGGEPTVTLCESPGRGGRNLQLTAVVLQEMLQLETAPREIHFASVGTDGEDGTAPVAGGWFDRALIDRIASDVDLRVELERCISTNDCYSFFNSVGHCVELPEGVQTNVCDLQILLIRPSVTVGL